MDLATSVQTLNKIIYKVVCNTIQSYIYIYIYIYKVVCNTIQ